MAQRPIIGSGRPRIDAQEAARSSGRLYFAQPKGNLEFIPSGCCTLDCVLGGGWALKRISNVVGDSGTGKTLIAEEACANFARAYPREGTDLIRYGEAEQAFDLEYAEGLGMPIERVEFHEDFDTVEQFYEDLNGFVHRVREKEGRGLYVLDSLDALSDAAEMDRAFDEDSFGAGKPKQMSKLFRMLRREISESNVHLMIISQIRGNLNAGKFGRQWSRSGGRALQFYCSQIISLAHIARLNKERSKIKRAYGVTIKAFCDKNKIGLPFRDCEFDILFGYGIEDFDAGLQYLKTVGRLKEFGVTEKEITEYIKELDTAAEESIEAERARLGETVKRVWAEIEVQFLPTRKKYGN